LRLVGVFQPLLDDAGALTLRTAWEETLLVQTWLTDAVYRRAIAWTLAHWEERGMPPVPKFLAICREMKAQLDRESATTDQDLTRPALAAPQVREAEAGEPHDPYSCTPEERRRWAEQDAWIRAWARRLPESLPPGAPEWERDAWERNQEQLRRRR